MSNPIYRQLSASLAYDPLTGIFKYTQPPHSRRRGGVAGGYDRDGYIRIKTKHGKFFAHRLAWLYMTGEWPNGILDHINRVRDDNRWCNLRLSNPQSNAENTRFRDLDGDYGIRYVTGWRVTMRLRGKVMRRGLFKTKEQARAARRGMLIQHRINLGMTDAYTEEWEKQHK